MQIVIVGPDLDRAMLVAQSLAAYVAQSGRLCANERTRWVVRRAGSSGAARGLFSIVPVSAANTLSPIQVVALAFDDVADPTSESALAEAAILVLVAEGEPSVRWTQWFDLLRSRMPGRRRKDLADRIAVPMLVLESEPSRAEKRRAIADPIVMNPLWAHFAWVETLTVALPPARNGKARPSPELADGLCRALKSINPLMLHAGLAGAIARTPAPLLVSYAAVLWTFGVVAPTGPPHAAQGACRAFSWARCDQVLTVTLAQINDFEGWTILGSLGVTVLSVLAWWLLSSRQTRTRAWSIQYVAVAAIIGAWTAVLLPRSLLRGMFEVIDGWGGTAPLGLIEAGLGAADFRLATLVSSLVVSLVVLSLLRAQVWRLPVRLYHDRNRAREALRA